MNLLFTLGLMSEIFSNDTTPVATIANLGMTEERFPTPLFKGDSVHCRTRARSKRVSRSRPGAGIVEFLHRPFDQKGTHLAECKRQAFLKRRHIEV